MTSTPHPPPEHPTEGPTRRAHPSRHESAPRRRRGRRRLWSAGHALLTTVVALGLATLLNANALLDTAEGLELETVKRDVAVGIMKPVQTVSEALRLTAPRSGVDSALGKEEIGTEEGEDAFAEFADESVAEGSESGNQDGSPSETTIAPRSVDAEPLAASTEVTEDDPLLLWVAGDSLSFEFGKAVIRAASGDELIDAVPEVGFEVASGLSRPDVYSWPRALAKGMAAHRPDVVVFMVGSNDDQSVTDPDGKIHACCDAGWQQEYARRVGAVMDQIAGTGRTMVYVNVPIMGGSTGSRNPNYEIINEMIEQEGELRPDVLTVDAYELFQNRNGNYSQYIAGEKVRADDNVHFERPGGDRLTDATLAIVRAAFGIADDSDQAEAPDSEESPATDPQSASTTSGPKDDPTTSTSSSPAAGE